MKVLTALTLLEYLRSSTALMRTHFPTFPGRTGSKPFKLFWITLNPARHSRVWRFVDEIEQFKSARIIYESKRGNDYYWQVRLNVEKEKPSAKTTPRILPREVTTSETATANQRAEVIAFSKTPEFNKMVESVVFEGVIEPNLEEGEIQEKRKAPSADGAAKKQRLTSKPNAGEAGITVEKYVRFVEENAAEKAKGQELSDYDKRMEAQEEAQEEALAEWEQREHESFIFNDEAALKAM